jgi:hypothetical protein
MRVTTTDKVIISVSLVFTVYFAKVWASAEHKLRPPVVQGISWPGKKPTLLIRFNGVEGCSCGTKLIESYKISRENGVDFIIVSSSTILSDSNIKKEDFPEAVFMDTEAISTQEDIGRRSEVFYIVNNRIQKRWFGITVVKGMITL